MNRVTKYRIGVVGAGFWAPNHIAAWKKIQGAELVALCDIDRPKLEEKAKQFDVPQAHLYCSIEEMLAECELDVVDIVTGPDTHPELVHAAARAGKHIMCQKPFARTIEAAEEMVRVAERYGVRLMVTENWRWLQPYQQIGQMIQSGTLGTLRAARYIHTDWYTPRMEPGVELPQPFFRDMEKLLFFEMGPHWFDTWRFLFGTPERLYAETAKISPHVIGEDTGFVILRGSDQYGPEFIGMMDMSWATRHKLDRPLGNEVGPVHLEQLYIDGDEARSNCTLTGASP